MIVTIVTMKLLRLGPLFWHVVHPINPSIFQTPLRILPETRRVLHEGFHRWRYPKIIHFHRVFQINQPFWGYPQFMETSMWRFNSPILGNLHTYIHIHTYTYIHIHIYIYIYTHTYTYIHKYIYICVCINIHITHGFCFPPSCPQCPRSPTATELSQDLASTCWNGPVLRRAVEDVLNVSHLDPRKCGLNIFTYANILQNHGWFIGGMPLWAMWNMTNMFVIYLDPLWRILLSNFRAYIYI